MSYIYALNMELITGINRIITIGKSMSQLSIIMILSGITVSCTND